MCHKLTKGVYQKSTIAFWLSRLLRAFSVLQQKYPNDHILMEMNVIAPARKTNILVLC